MNNANEESYEQIRAERDAYRAELSAVMPPEYTDWWHNSKLEWPLVAAVTISSLLTQRDMLSAALAAGDERMSEQRAHLIDMWAGSKRTGRWLSHRDGDECSPDTPDAEWYPYEDDDQARWLRDGVVPLLERMLFALDDEVEPIIPEELLKEHGFHEEPEDEDINN